MMDETMSDAAGNIAFIFVSKVVHCSALISPPLQSFIQSGRPLCLVAVGLASGVGQWSSC